MLADIPVRIERNTPSEQLLKAVLHEITANLKKLHDERQASAIDLRGIFTPHQTPALKKLLGQGEVFVKLSLTTSTEIEETAVNGVWWITHYDDNGEKFCEIIEITTIPELLSSNYDDLENSIQKIQMIAQYMH